MDGLVDWQIRLVCAGIHLDGWVGGCELDQVRYSKDIYIYIFLYHSIFSSASILFHFHPQSLSRSLHHPIHSVYPDHSRFLSLPTSRSYSSAIALFPLCHTVLSTSISPAVLPRKSAVVADMHNWSGGASSLKGTDVLVGGRAWSCGVAC